MKKFEAILLTAGKSSRMGQDKALLEIDGRKVINIILEKLVNACSARGSSLPQINESIEMNGELSSNEGRISSNEGRKTLPLHLILGHHCDLIKESIEEQFLDKINIVYNENHLEGMYSSIKKGVSSLSGNNSFILHMIDQPFIDQELYFKIRDEYDGHSPICQPCYIAPPAPQPPKGGATENAGRGNALVLAQPSLNGKLGHPIVINKSLIPSIKNDTKNVSLRDFFKPYYKDIQLVEYDKNTILQNLNNYESFRTALEGN